VGDRLGMGRYEGGPGGPLMLRSPKLQKGQVTPRGPKWGFPKLQHPIFMDLGSLDHVPKMRGCKKKPPHVCPLVVSCP